MKYAVTLKKGNNCHKDYSAVMNNSGFSGITIHRNEMIIYIPSHGIKKDGRLKKCWQDRLKNFTVEDAIWLNTKIAA